MIFNLDYQSFLNLNDCSPDQFKIVKSDFVSNLVDLLRDMGCDPYITDSIAYTLFSSMFNDKVYYHTPVHILFMLSYAQENHVPLENWEKLAIFFHDAIYRPGSKFNEQNSVTFMSSLLNGVGISVEDLRYASDAIADTALHLSDNITEMNWRIMDLDLAGFAANPKPFNLQNQLIEMEFCQPNKNNYGYPVDQFLHGRMTFLTAMKARASLYHTEIFKTTLNMEVKAQVNLDNQIKETQRRIDNLNKKKK